MRNSAALDESATIDYLIIGGGAAGCVLAARLSENPSSRVVLVEQGKTFEADAEPSSITDVAVRSMFDPSLVWGGLTAIGKGDPDTVADSAALPYVAGRALGGGSSVNGMLVHRGLPGDYDEWTDHGVSGWRWDDVLPFFRKLESDRDFDGPRHGKAGPMTIQRFGPDKWSPFERAVGDAWKQRQLPWMADLTGDQDVGFGPMPLNVDGGKRMSAARAYLTAQVRSRPNLSILGETEATQLAITDGRMSRVRLTSGGAEKTLRAGTVIVSAGAIASPALLLRSGIGSGESLARLGIAPSADRPGVGANLQEHATLLIAAHIRRSARRTKRLPPCLSFARYSSGVTGCHEADMMATTMGAAPGPTAWNPLGRAFASMLSIVHKPYSRGAVRLTAEGQPRVMFNMLADERDLARMIAGWETIRSIVTSGERARLVNQAFVPLTLGRTDDSLTTAMVSTLANQILDGPDALRRRILKSVGVPIETVPAGGDALRDWVMMFTTPAAHASGTCRMGRADDPQAVVDSDCRVIGVDGLRVVDSSIFPTLMRSGTHIPTIMAAEKVAAAITRAH